MRKTKLKLLPKRGSNPISKLLRPILEKPVSRRFLGGFLSATSLMAAVISPTSESLASGVNFEVAVEVEVGTSRTGLEAILPLMTGVSQGFNPFHKGIDITAPKGAEIYPFRDGVVARIENSAYGYGRSVVIRHDDGYASRYAHLGKIKVEEGERVSVKTSLGEVGLTGKTTGYHLHLEIKQGETSLNPFRLVSNGVTLSLKR
ncbi:M23 family metallopeptidase [Candidatus Collierbacteria bacterium]|nr:M23 family metallopeptidase [Candidatus Collierbacteria bacterium]